MILVLDTEVQADYRYLAPEIRHHLPAETEYRVFPENPVVPDVDRYDGIVLSGSTASVYEADERGEWLQREFALIRRCLDEAVPVLGICFGHQAVNAALGGSVERDQRRATFVEMERTRDDEILEGVNDVVPVLHADVVTRLGDGMVRTARTAYDEFFCSRHGTAPLWTVQFHPEFTERVVDEPSDWDGDRTWFEAVNATRVLENFHAATERRR